MKAFVLSGLLIYLTVCLLLFLLQRQFLYFPQKALPVFDVNTINFEIEDITLKGWVLHEGKSKALIYYGGNAENIEINIDFFKRFLQDTTIYLIPYRGYGGNPGNPTENSLYRDALQIFDFVKSKHTELTLMGRSLGSGIATYVGAKRKISRMILVTPFDSIENVAKEIYWMFPIKFLIKDRYRSIDRATSIKAPVLMLVASMDGVIPRKHSMNLKSYFDPAQLTNLEFDGTGHNDIHLHPDYPKIIQNFLSSQISVN